MTQRLILAVSEELTEDDFLSGLVRLHQPRTGFRAGVDAVLLAAAVQARDGQTVLDVGCGVGTAALCLNARVQGLKLTGIELQDQYAQLANRNGEAAGAKFEVVSADITDLPAEIRQRQFDHVITNPPYFDRADGASSLDLGRDIALAGDTDLSLWLSTSAKRVAAKGYLTVIQRIERLPETLTAVSNQLGSIRVLPIAPRAKRAPKLFILQAQQDGHAPFTMLPPLIMHQGESHSGDKESYTSVVRDILRNGAALNWKS